ncbi:hypothetical protein CMMCAS02_01595 [Clavibacter michiganensis subsp. michiganensis]|nr:hypothetical protein CMMCAS02_01595 [Clavibacter michiganensis subsp. michiganensis]
MRVRVGVVRGRLAVEVEGGCRDEPAVRRALRGAQLVPRGRRRRRAVGRRRRGCGAHGHRQAQQRRRARAGADGHARGSAVDLPGAARAARAARALRAARARRVDRRDRPQRVVPRAGLGREDPARTARQGCPDRRGRVRPARVQRRRVARAEAELDDRHGIPVGLERQPADGSVARRDEAQRVTAAREIRPLDRRLAADRVHGATHPRHSTRGADHEGRADAERIRPYEIVAVAAVPRARHELGGRGVGVAGEEGATDRVEAGPEVGRVRPRVHRREPALVREGDGDRVGGPVRDGTEAAAADDDPLLPGRCRGRGREDGRDRGCGGGRSVRVVARGRSDDRVLPVGRSVGRASWAVPR